MKIPWGLAYTPTTSLENIIRYMFAFDSIYLQVGYFKLAISNCFHLLKTEAKFGSP